MSHTFTNRPSVTRAARGRGTSNGTGARTGQAGRGRGTGTSSPRGRGRGRTGNATKPNQDDSTAGDTAAQERVQRRDAYTMFVPDEKKRNKVAEQAKKEEMSYQQYKESKKLGHVSYVGTAGGGEMTATQEESRRRLVQDQRGAAFNRRQKSQQWREQQKQQDDREYQKKKDLARKKSEENERRDVNRKQGWEQDHKRKNDAFLARLEKESKGKASSRTTTVSSTFPAAAASRNSDGNIEEYGATGTSELPLSSQHNIAGVRQLQEYFPQYAPGYLQEILDSVNGDLLMAKDLLS